MQTANEKGICYLVMNRMKTFYTCSKSKRNNSSSMLESKYFLNSSIHKSCSISIWLCYYTYMLVSYSFLILHGSKMISFFFFLAINLSTLVTQIYILCYYFTFTMLLFSLYYYFTFFQSQSCISFLFCVLKYIFSITYFRDSF